MNRCLMELPEALLREIFFRLPMNSIIKTKLVCTAMYKLISDPNFALNYAKLYPFSSVVFNPGPTRSFELLEFSNNYEECFRTIFRPPNKVLDGKYSREFYIVGACNGLLCLATREKSIVKKKYLETIYICNPITGECKDLPVRVEEKCSSDYSQYAFGFCRSTDNCKVLLIRDTFVAIFTIGSSYTWRYYDNPTSQISGIYNNLIALNGTFHSIILVNDSQWIRTFDLWKEKIGRLSLPQGLVMNSYKHFRLVAITNQLCLVDRTNPFEIVIWKMKEYGVTESWTKDVVLDTSFTQCHRKPILETILQNGDILFSSRSEGCISYDPIKRKVTKMQVHRTGPGTITFTPNLLSLEEALAGAHIINL